MKKTYQSVTMKLARSQLQRDRVKGRKNVLKVIPLDDREGVLAYQEGEPYLPDVTLRPGDKFILMDQSGFYEVCYLQR